jgi:hypothetical protein
MHSLLSWLSQSQNSTLLLLVVTTSSALLTALYVALTYSMARAASRQTIAMLQPVLSLDLHYQDPRNGSVTGTISPLGSVEIRNTGQQPVVLADVRLRCFVRGKVIKEIRYSLENRFLGPGGDKLYVRFDFRNSLTPNQNCSRDFSLQLLAVASDLSHQVVVEYEFLPVLHLRYSRIGMPWRVRIERAKAAVSPRRLLRFLYLRNSRPTDTPP